MAKRSYLTEQEQAQALKLWQQKTAKEVSNYLQDVLVGKIASLPHAKDLQIFGMGSLARAELCPYSDVDLLILGPNHQMKAFMRAALEAPFKIRARTFEKPEHIFEGAQAFDLLSMMDLVPLIDTGKQELRYVQSLVRETLVKSRRQILSVLKQEKQDRKKRFDSLVSYLEPNIKLGSGGLRDIQQSLYIFRLYPEFFSRKQRNRVRIEKQKMKLLYWRQGLHLLGFADSMVAQAQLELMPYLNYKSIQRMMTSIEKCFSEAAFYSSWAFAKLKNMEPPKLPKAPTLQIRDLKRILSKDSSEVTQEALRNKKLSSGVSLTPYKDLRQLIHSDMPEDVLMALFDSKMMSRIFPDLKKTEGLVQHDQYHLLTVDAHLKQAMRIVLRLKKNPKYLGNKVRVLIAHFKKKDWEIIFWTAFFHDLAKGRKGDHSSVGKRLAERILRKLKFDDHLIQNVAWLTENHLVFSTGAFRRNPQSAKTIHWLMSRGVKGWRATHLAAFTAIDIYATNPSAWNSWKEKLIVQLHEELTSSRAKKLERFLLGLSQGVLSKNLEFYSQIDQRLISELPSRVLKNDLKALQEKKSALEPLVVSAGGSRFWIRFHHPEDQDGLFLKYVRALHASGLSVSEAFVQGFDADGVYDWFLVKGSREKESIKKMLKMSLSSSEEVQIAKTALFDEVEVIEQDEDMAIISFRGTDQKGALLTAAASVYESKLPIVWAKVVTWGRRIDDVFCVRVNKGHLETYKNSLIPHLLRSDRLAEAPVRKK